MKIGVVLPHNEIGSDAGAMKAYAQGVEALGADHLLIYDHVLGADPDRPGGWKGAYNKDTQFHEPMTTLSYIAGITEQIELVTTVLILPQRQTALVAKQAAQIALLSNNRLRLGVGTGWNEVEYEALNVPFRARGRRQEEQVELLRQLWSSDSLSFSGEFHEVTLASINPRPSKPIPIWFGGGAPAVLARCAEMGNGWMPLMGPNHAAQEAVTQLQSLWTEKGKDWNDFGIQAQAQCAGGTPERWLSHYQRWQAIGATHMAIATHNAAKGSVDEHLSAIASYMEAIR
ncbi:MAG: LLM class F420-dependent oxidoreductase [Gammaproteobacteria bacterium]|nr:LLM class F420-dependent oxidoreductase [Gammaproteobacteria bacterium]